MSFIISKILLRGDLIGISSLCKLIGWGEYGKLNFFF